MSAILEAVRADIAQAEEAKTALEERLASLREIETLAVAVYGEPETEEQQQSEPAPPKPPAPVRPNTEEESERRADEILELLSRVGPQTEAEIRRTTGWTPKSVKKALDRLEARGGAKPTGAARSQRGTPSREWEAASAAPAAEEPASPESAAPASSTDDAGADLSTPAADNSTTTDEALDGDLVDDDTAEEVVVEIDDYDRGGRKPGQGKDGDRIPREHRALADEIKAVCELEPKALPTIAEAVGVDPKLARSVIAKLVALRELQSYGAVKVDGKPRPTYRVTPSLAEQGVEVKHAERSDNIEEDIAARLRDDGPLSIGRLSAALCRHPREIAAAVAELISRGEVAKRPGYPDAVYALAGSEIGRPGLPALR